MGLAVVLLLIVVILPQCIEWLWDSMDWQQTDMEAFEALMAPYLSPLGAIILGVAAGLGEDLVVRGVLSPGWVSGCPTRSLPVSMPCNTTGTPCWLYSV